MARNQINFAAESGKQEVVIILELEGPRIQTQKEPFSAGLKILPRWSFEWAGPDLNR